MIFDKSTDFKTIPFKHISTEGDETNRGPDVVVYIVFYSQQDNNLRISI